MTDVHDKQTRSRNMAAIKARNTKPELWLRKHLHAKGFRYRLNVKDLPGKPDLVLRKYNAVIFINGCYWHMHDCPQFKLPKSRTEWWHNKLSGNKERDQRNITALRAQNWRVLSVWECAIKGRQKLSEDDLTEQVTKWLTGENNQSEIRGTEA